MAASTTHGISHLTCLNCHVEDTVKAQAGHAQFNKSHMTATLPSHYSNKITIAVVNSSAFQGTNSMANITSESNWYEPKIYYHYAKQIVYQALAVQLQTGFYKDQTKMFHHLGYRLLPWTQHCIWHMPKQVLTRSAAHSEPRTHHRQQNPPASLSEFPQQSKQRLLRARSASIPLHGVPFQPKQQSLTANK